MENDDDYLKRHTKLMGQFTGLFHAIIAVAKNMERHNVVPTGSTISAIEAEIKNLSEELQGPYVKESLRACINRLKPGP